MAAVDENWVNTLQDSVLGCCSPRRKSPGDSGLVLDMHFQQVADEVKAWKPYKPTSNEQKLRLYALYKQAQVGDAPTDPPSASSWDVAATYKWRAWSGLRAGSSQ